MGLTYLFPSSFSSRARVEAISLDGIYDVSERKADIAGNDCSAVVETIAA